MKLTENDIDRFWKKVDKAGDCWEWKYFRGKQGYGMFWLSTKGHLAHRVSWMITHGEIPPGMCVCHICDNTRCVNPEHLFLGTHTDNMRDMKNKGRLINNKGENHGMSRFRKSEIIEIREKYKTGKFTQKEIGKQYGVSQGVISNITSRKTWKHI